MYNIRISVFGNLILLLLFIQKHYKYILQKPFRKPFVYLLYRSSFLESDWLVLSDRRCRGILEILNRKDLHIPQTDAVPVKREKCDNASKFST